MLFASILSALSEKRLSSRLEIRVLALSGYFTASEKHAQFSCPALKMISHTNSAISYLDGHNLKTAGHCLRDHGTETKNNFDSVTRSLN